MTILERLLRHDTWTTRSLLLLAQGLPPSDLDREFEIGHCSLRRTFLHIIRNMEIWCDLMTDCPQRTTVATETTLPALLARLEIISSQLIELGSSVEKLHREEELFVDYLDEPPSCKPLGAGLVHLATHGMHHRAQCLYILRGLGVEKLPEGDVFSWESAHLNRGDSRVLEL